MVSLCAELRGQEAVLREKDYVDFAGRRGRIKNAHSTVDSSGFYLQLEVVYREGTPEEHTAFVGILEPLQTILREHGYLPALSGRR